MSDYGELALALQAKNYFNTDEQILKQIQELSVSSKFPAKKLEILIWEKLIEGDKEALGELYDTYVNILFSYGMYHSKDRGYVMDCIHDLFVELYNYRKNLSMTDNVKYYLFKSLKRKINKKYNNKNVAVFFDEDKYKIKTLQKTHTDSCENEIINKENTSEINAKLSNALKTLTKKQRKIIDLRFTQEMTYEEISKIMGISVQTARTSIYRIIKALRKQKFL